MKTRPCTKKQSPSQRVLPMEVFWEGKSHPGNPMGLVESWAPKWNDHIGDTPHVETKKHENMRGSGIYFLKKLEFEKKHFATVVDIGSWSHAQGSRSLLRFKQWTSMTMVSDLPWIFHCFWVEVGRTLPPKSILGRFMPPPVLQSGLLGLVVVRNPQDGTGVPSSRDRLQKQFWITLGIACHQKTKRNSG